MVYVSLLNFVLANIQTEHICSMYMVFKMSGCHVILLFMGA